jgi:hypothetical protein
MNCTKGFCVVFANMHIIHLGQIHPVYITPSFFFFFGGTGV